LINIYWDLIIFYFNRCNKKYLKIRKYIDISKKNWIIFCQCHLAENICPERKQQRKNEKQPDPVVEETPIAEEEVQEEVQVEVQIVGEEIADQTVDDKTVVEEEKPVTPDEVVHKKTQTSNSGIIIPEKFKANNLSTTIPRKKKINGTDKINALLLHNNMPIYLETPWCKAPFGVSAFKPNADDPAQKLEWSLNLSASSINENDENEKMLVNLFFEEWIKVEGFMIQHGIDNSKLIFGKETKSFEVMKERFYDIVKGKDTEYPPRIQPKIGKARDKDKQIIETKPNVTVFMAGSTEPLEVNTFEDLQKIVPKGAVVKCILQPRLYYIGTKYGISLNILQLLVKKRSGQRPEGYAFSHVPEDEDKNYDSGSDTNADENTEKTENTENSDGEGSNQNSDAQDSDKEAE